VLPSEKLKEKTMKMSLFAILYFPDLMPVRQQGNVFFFYALF